VKDALGGKKVVLVYFSAVRVVNSVFPPLV
jgi:hypothetical protein